MKKETHDKVFYYEEFPSNLWGLKFIPSLTNTHPTEGINNGIGDHADWMEFGYINGKWSSMQFIHTAVEQGTRAEFTTENKIIVGDILDKLFKKKEKITILEIGVGRSGITSSSEFIVNKKRERDSYIGIDINNSVLVPYDNKNKNQFTINIDSGECSKIIKICNDFGFKEVDFILIDGKHSIFQVLLEWELVIKLLSLNGYVGFHDTNYHPGPYCIFEAIDENMFEKVKYCENVKNDPGISFAKRLEML